MTVCDWNDPYYESPSLWVCSEGLFVVIGGDKLEFGSDKLPYMSPLKYACRIPLSQVPFIFVSNITGNKVTYDAEKFIDQET